jgi:hypothetical protein
VDNARGRGGQEVAPVFLFCERVVVRILGYAIVCINVDAVRHHDEARFIAQRQRVGSHRLPDDGRVFIFPTRFKIQVFLQQDAAARVRWVRVPCL